MLQPHNQGLNLERQLVGMSVRSSASVCQALKTCVFIPLKDLVTRLARDTELPAQRRHLLALKQPGDKLHTFIHHVTLPPRHPTLLAKGQKCNLCLRYEM
jgi:hypothetical protein